MSKLKSQPGLVWVEDTLTSGLENFPEQLDVGLRGVMKYHEPQVQSYMKGNAPWTDRTGNARNGLEAKAVSGDGIHAIVCYHQVPYGIWLEIAHNGKYRIIVPTIITQGREVMTTVRGLLARLS